LADVRNILAESIETTLCRRIPKERIESRELTFYVRRISREITIYVVEYQEK
jgi:hypothetical protein